LGTVSVLSGLHVYINGKDGEELRTVALEIAKRLAEWINVLGCMGYFKGEE